MSFTKVESRGLDAGHVGVMTAGGLVGTGFTMLNFIGAGNTFAVHDTRIDISIAGGGGTGSEILKETFNVSATQSVFNITQGQFSAGFLEVYLNLSLIHISEPTRRRGISYAVFCLKKKI